MNKSEFNINSDSGAQIDNKFEVQSMKSNIGHRYAF